VEKKEETFESEAVEVESDCSDSRESSDCSFAASSVAEASNVRREVLKAATVRGIWHRSGVKAANDGLAVLRMLEDVRRAVARGAARAKERMECILIDRLVEG
jgi:hypothetical protein